MRVKFFCLRVFIALLFAGTSVAQDKKPTDDDVLRIDTQLVDVPLAVTSPAGTPLIGLKASNFVVFEDA